MRGLIEAGVVLFIVYLFLQWEKQGGAAGPGAANPFQNLFAENIGSPSQGIINESEPSSAKAIAPPSSGPVAAPKIGGCGCGGLS